MGKKMHAHQKYLNLKTNKTNNKTVQKSSCLKTLRVDFPSLSDFPSLLLCLPLPVRGGSDKVREGEGGSELPSARSTTAPGSRSKPARLVGAAALRQELTQSRAARHLPGSGPWSAAEGLPVATEGTSTLSLSFQ